MLTKIWFRGLRASGYLVVRSLKAMVLLAALPISLLVGWAFPSGTASLVRLANDERRPLLRVGRSAGVNDGQGRQAGANPAGSAPRAWS